MLPIEYGYPGSDYLTAAFENHYNELGQGYTLPATAFQSEETNKFYA